MAKSNSRLGRGLQGIIASGGTSQPTKKEEKPATEPETLELKQIAPNPYQPRRSFCEEEIAALAQSIDSQGLLQPIVVRKLKSKNYELIAGERRFRAYKHLKRKSIPVRVVKVSDQESALLALIENLQREDLNPVDQAMGYQCLVRDFKLTQEQISQKVGRGRASVANSLRLLNLDDETLGFLSKGLITVGHAKVLLSIENSVQRSMLAHRIMREGLNVRQTEAALKSIGTNYTRVAPPLKAQDAVIQDLIQRIGSHLQTPVEVKPSGKGGKLVINYKNHDELNKVLDKMGFFRSKKNFAA